MCLRKLISIVVIVLLACVAIAPQAQAAPRRAESLHEFTIDFTTGNYGVTFPLWNANYEGTLDYPSVDRYPGEFIETGLTSTFVSHRFGADNPIGGGSLLPGETRAVLFDVTWQTTVDITFIEINYDVDRGATATYWNPVMVVTPKTAPVGGYLFDLPPSPGLVWYWVGNATVENNNVITAGTEDAGSGSGAVSADGLHMVCSAGSAGHDAGAPPAPDPGGYCTISSIRIQYWGEEATLDFPDFWGYEASRPVRTSDTWGTFDIGTYPDAEIITPANALVHAPFAGVVNKWSEGGLDIVQICNDDVCATISNLGLTYVITGDTVTQDCVIGLAGPPWTHAASVTQAGDKGSVLFNAFVKADPDMPIEWADWAEPASDTICAEEPTSLNCLTQNPFLKDAAAGWADGGENTLLGWGVSRGDGYVSISGRAFVYQSLVLTPDTDYYVTLAAAPGFSIVGGNAEAEITIGEESTVVNIPEPAVEGDNQYSIITTPALHLDTPDLPGDTFTLKVGPNNKDVGIKLAEICLHTEPTLTEAPGECWFPDPAKFDSSTAWILEDGAVSETPGNGILANIVRMPDTSSIHHAIDIDAWDDTALQYRLSVEAITYGSTILSNLDPSNAVTIQASVIDGETTVKEWDEWTVDNSLYTKTYSYTDSIAVEDSLTGNFYLTVNDVAGSALGVRVSKVCFTRLNGTAWPGHEDADLHAGELIHEFCVNCIPPAGVDVFAWLAYIACQMANLFFCYLAPVINKISQTITGIMITLSLLGTWLAATLFSFIRSLGNAIASILAYALGAFIGAIFASPLGMFLADLLDLANLLLSWALIFTGTIVAILSRVISSMMVLIGLMVGFWQTLLAGFNTSPASVTLFSCAPSDPLHNACIGLALVDGVITDIPALNAMSLMGAGIYIIYTLVWFLRQVIGGIEGII